MVTKYSNNETNISKLSKICRFAKLSNEEENEKEYVNKQNIRKPKD